VLVCQSYTKDKITDILASEKRDSDVQQNWQVHPEDRGLLGSICHPRPSTVMSAYRMEWAIQLSLVVVYMAVTLGAQAPGCPRGYMGPGGIGDGGEHAECTGGIHRYVDIMLFTNDLIYHAPTCKELYSCQSYDPEGFLGVLTASFLTYLGLMSGRVLIHFPTHRERLTRWAIWTVALLLLAGIFCGFSKNDGFMPINKNLWTTSFGLVTAGGGLVCLGTTYVLVDVLKVWSGAPFISMGMNSILIYVGHDILGTFFPFSYETNSGSHARVLQMNLIGVTCWVLIAVYLHRIKFFVKI
jgi:heparan-alpha-glucosaminide N-acetyltransferase